MDIFETIEKTESYENNKTRYDCIDPFIYPGRNNTSVGSYVPPNSSEGDRKKSEVKPVILNTSNQSSSVRNYYKSKWNTSHRYTKRTYKIGQLARLTVASVFLIVFTALMVFFSGVLGADAKSKKFAQYDKFIWPVVVQDPEPFNEQNPPGEEMMLNASVLKAASEQKPDCMSSGDDGRVIVSLDQVKKSCNVLFGKNFKLFNENNDLFTNFYEFKGDEKIFYVNAISNDRCFIPETVSSDNHDKYLTLKVGYATSWNKHETPNNMDNNTKKYMNYKLKENSETGQFYICEVSPEKAI